MHAGVEAVVKPVVNRVVRVVVVRRAAGAAATGAFGGIPGVVISVGVSLLFEGIRYAWNKINEQPPPTPPMPTVPGKSADQLREEAQETLGIDCLNNYNFAIVGRGGTGKSSLVNALLTVNDSNPDAAAVGDGKHTTVEITAYRNDEYEHILFWDTPGADVGGNQSVTYFVDQMLYAFSCLIIVTDSRFTETDFQIAQAARENGTPYVFVRSKADFSLQAKKRRTQGLSDADAVRELKQEVQEDFRLQLQQLNMQNLLESRLFVISSWAATDNQVDGVDFRDFVNYLESFARSA